jgi:hypothetical protein
MGKFFYRDVEPAELEPSVLAQAEAMLDYCKKALGLSGVPLRIRWVAEIGEGVFKFDAALKGVEDLCCRMGAKRNDAPDKMHRNPDSFFGQTGGGLLERGVLKVRADIPEREILLTIAHECQHAADYEVYRPPWTDAEKKAWEDHAEAFAREALATLISKKGWQL